MAACIFLLNLLSVMVSSNFNVRPVFCPLHTTALPEQLLLPRTFSFMRYNSSLWRSLPCSEPKSRGPPLPSLYEKGSVPPCALRKSSSIHGSDLTRLRAIAITVAWPLSSFCSPSSAWHPTWPRGYFTPSLALPSLLSMYKFHYFISFGSFFPYGGACGVTMCCQGLS